MICVIKNGKIFAIHSDNQVAEIRNKYSGLDIIHVADDTNVTLGGDDPRDLSVAWKDARYLLSSLETDSPFRIKSAFYSEMDAVISVLIASGTGETFSGNTINTITKTTDTTFNITSPLASTTYTIYLKNDGNFASSIDGTIADGSILIGTISTNADKTVNIITDKRPLISGVGQEFVNSKIKEYGVEWDKSVDTITRLGDASELTRSSFDYLFPWKDMRRCNLSDSGTVNAYSGDPSYKTDGTNGQCMVEIPKFYYKVINAPGGNTNKIQFWISNTKKEGYETHPAFYRDRSKLCDDNSGTAVEVDKRYIGTYQGVQQNGSNYVGGSGYNSSTKNYNSSYKLASVSGYSPINNITIGEGRTLAKNRGNGWSQQDYYLTYAIQLLYLIEYANFNSQAQIGNGNSNSTTVLNSGATNSYGNASYGTTANTSSAMSYRGIENFYGNIYMWVDGFYCNASRNILIGNKGFNDTGSNYDYSYTTGLGANVFGYITDIFGDKRTGFVVKTAGGSETTKLCDYGYLCASCLPAFGGACGNGGCCGCFFLYCSVSASDSSWNVGARLAF